MARVQGRWDWGRRHCLTVADSPARRVRGTLGGVSGAPIVVHRPSNSGGRRVTVRRRGQDKILDTAYSDHDLVVFLEGAGVADPEALLDDPQCGEWRGSPLTCFMLPNVVVKGPQLLGM